ncbi:MAG: hypothetical protein QM740_04900 [Acidovorax sp.]
MKPLSRDTPLRRMAQRVLALAHTWLRAEPSAATGAGAEPFAPTVRNAGPAHGTPAAADPVACRPHILTLSAAMAAADQEIEELMADSSATAATSPHTLETLKAALRDIHAAARQLDSMADEITTASAALTAQAQQLQKAVALFRRTSHQKQEQLAHGVS